MDTPNVLGYDLDRETLTPLRGAVRAVVGDYGCDPLGENSSGVFMFKMVPSGDVVNAAERARRLDDEPKKYSSFQL